MSDESITPLADIAAPWGKSVQVQEVAYEGGLALLRLRIREGKRFTMLDLDAATAAQLGELMAEWARARGEVQK